MLNSQITWKKQYNGMFCTRVLRIYKMFEIIPINNCHSSSFSERATLNNAVHTSWWRSSSLTQVLVSLRWFWFVGQTWSVAYLFRTRPPHHNKHATCFCDRLTRQDRWRERSSAGRHHPHTIIPIPFASPIYIVSFEIGHDFFVIPRER